VNELLSNVGAGGGAPATGSGPAAAFAGGEVVAEEKTREEKEEKDNDMVGSSLLVSISKLIDFFINQGFNLFD